VSEPQAIGVFIVGALGDVATTAAVGAAALARGLAGTTGLVTALDDFRGAGLAPLGSLRLGGVDVREGDVLENARTLAARDWGILDPRLVEQVAPELAAVSRRVGRGFLLGAAGPVEALAAPEVRAARPSARDALASARAAIRRFREQAAAERVVVVHLASTEPRDADAEALPDDAALERRLDDASRPPPASLVWALAALEERCPHVNFTPSCGAAAPALAARAARAGVPVAGRDGKTGETLLKSALAPLFVARNLRVLSWAGYNILGNRDGRVLDDARAKAAKVATKGSSLAAILGPGRLGTEHVEIEYVPSIGDWKTAWDHIHFEGFLGTRMALELTWRGADSILAAPLVLDLVRLLERAARAGRAGVVPELACFFKDPAGTAERALPAQMLMLEALARSFSPGAPLPHASLERGDAAPRDAGALALEPHFHP
jgi:myo-inositol-1-phosphate synthase